MFNQLLVFTIRMLREIKNEKTERNKQRITPTPYLRAEPCSRTNMERGEEKHTTNQSEEKEKQTGV